MAEDVHYLDLLAVSDRVRRRTLTSEAVTRALLNRIARHDGRLRSIHRLRADRALAEARRADAEIAAGFWRGPLHGVPIGIKDLLWTAGEPTSAGMDLLKDFTPTADATVVRRLRQAGAVLIAKLHMTEGATLHHHPSLPRPVNPWSAAHWTGVSSSGSGVAPAAGFCFGAIGTDTGGSIRMPSSANSLTGIKPTWGRVSRHGLVHLSQSLDHIGPMARSCADAAAILQAIAGADPDDDTALTEPVPDYLAERDRGVSDLSIGVDWDFVSRDMPAEIVEAVRGAAAVFEALGARIRPITFPTREEDAADLGAMTQAEIYAVHAADFPEKADRYGPSLRTMLERGRKADVLSVVRGYQARDRLKGRLAAVFRDVDLILTPGLGDILPTWERIDSFGDEIATRGRNLVRFTSPYNMTGVPTLSLPGGFTDEGLPIGIQLAAARLGEPTLIRAGCAFQRATDFHTRRPPLDS